MSKEDSRQELYNFLFGNCRTSYLEYEEEKYPESDEIIDSDRTFSPYWLETVVGSLAEERRNSRTKSYRIYNLKARKASNFAKEHFSLLQLLDQPDHFLIKLSDLEALYPSLTVFFRINIQELTQSNQRLLRSFLLFYYQQEVDPWIKYLIEESLDKILTKERFLTNKEKVFRENFIIRQTFQLLGKDQGLQTIKNIYSDQNLLRWYKTGENLVKQYCCVKIPSVYLKERIRRRGYKESSSNNPKRSKDQGRRVKESMENRTLEEIKQEILRKQAILFERRLDSYLQLEDPNIPKSKKKEIFSNLVHYDSEDISSQEKLDETLKTLKLNLPLKEE